jgi:hypothetical protein
VVATTAEGWAVRTGLGIGVSEGVGSADGVLAKPELAGGASAVAGAVAGDTAGAAHAPPTSITASSNAGNECLAISNSLPVMAR